MLFQAANSGASRHGRKGEANPDCAHDAALAERGDSGNRKSQGCGPKCGGDSWARTYSTSDSQDACCQEERDHRDAEQFADLKERAANCGDRDCDHAPDHPDAESEGNG